MGLGAEEQGRTVQDQVAKVKELTGVDLPKYYNPAAINPLRYAEQIKKRKMLWSKPAGDGGGPSAAPAAPAPEVVTPPQNTNYTQPQTSFNQWETTNLGDSRANEKFRRLMGIKATAPAPAPAPPAAKGHAPVKDTEKMFREQEQQYERARAATHTQRGLGLGFSGSAAPPQEPPAPPAVPPHLVGNPLLSKINFVRK